jgi:hypothetical protein
MEPFVSEGWRLVHLHGETIQRRVLLRDALMKILALKVSEVRRQQPAIALDIPLMAQDFLGSHIDRHRRRLFSEGHKGPFGWWCQGFAPPSGIQHANATMKAL